MSKLANVLIWPPDHRLETPDIDLLQAVSTAELSKVVSLCILHKAVFCFQVQFSGNSTEASF